MFHVPEKYRLKEGFMSSTAEIGNNGAFVIPVLKVNMIVIASDGFGWEHVSVSHPDRCPVWEEMCIIKDLFWDEDDAVMQLHPAKSEYINNCSTCLHLWRPTNADIPIPDSIFVGVK